MVDLVVLPLLIACDLPLWLLHQVAHPSDLRALPHGVLHRLGEGQPGFVHPLVQPPVDCRAKTPMRLNTVFGGDGRVGGGDILTSHIVDVELLPALLLVEPRLNDLRRVWETARGAQ